MRSLLVLNGLCLFIQPNTLTNCLAFSSKIKSRRELVYQLTRIGLTTMLKHSDNEAKNSNCIRIGFTGDVMIGRGIDAILPHHVDGRLHESFVKHAQTYVDLAVRENGQLSQDELSSKGFSYIWGDLSDDLNNLDCLVINLETSLTISNDWAPNKGIHYRSHPLNVECLKTVGVRVATLANNHVLDFGAQGLVETLDTLKKANILYAGAGMTLEEATAPVLIKDTNSQTPSVLLTALGFPSAGVPESWRAQRDTCGLYVAHEPDGPLAQHIMTQMKIKSDSERLHRSIKVVSLHWGSNWGYDISERWRSFAHSLIDHGADIVVGHSSHHVKGIEIYKDKMIAYGMGDFLNDYEGIVGQGYEDFRNDLCCLYVAKLDLSDDGHLMALNLIPGKIKHLKVQRATDPRDIRWLVQTFRDQGKAWGTSCDTVLDTAGNVNLKITW